MPLPNDWKGAFWGPGLMDDILFDNTGEEFVRHMIGFEGEDALPFYVIGAWFDLKRYGDEERANAIMAAAEAKVPFLWEKAREYADSDLTKKVDGGAEPSEYCRAMGEVMRMLWRMQGAPPPLEEMESPPTVN